MFKKIKIFVLSAMVAVSISFNCFAFEVSSLSSYHSVATKTMTATDSIQNRNRQIMGTNSFTSVFGEVSTDFQIEYIYVGQQKIMEKGRARWGYICPPSWNGRCKGQLRYGANDVMVAAQPGDLMIVGRRDDSEIDLIIIQQGNPMVAEVYAFLAKSPTATPPQERTSFWAGLFGSSRVQEEPADEEVESVSDLILSADLSRTDVDIYRNNRTGQQVITGTITKMPDGDTFFIQDIFRVRMAGIDAPESWQMCKDAKGKEYNCGKAATEYLKKLVGKSKVVCTHIKFEKWGRHLWDCKNSRGQNLGREMVLAGHAVVYLSKDNLDAQKEAQKAKRGMWQGEFTMPAEARKQRQQSRRR